MSELAKVAPPKRPITVEGKTVQLDLAALKAAFGTDNQDFVFGLVRQIVNLSNGAEAVDEEGVAFATSVVGGVEPRDQLEAMLAAQMAAVHVALMNTAQRLAHVETIKQFEANERSLNRLARTYAMQLEALKRYRSGGQQKVTVEHVTVNQGGQAIVGNVQQASKK